MRGILLAIAVAGILSLAPNAECQWKQPPSTGSPENHLPDRTKMAGQSGMGPLLTARLIDQEENAKKHQVVVEVQTDGVLLVQATATQNDPKLDEAQIQYSLDEQPVQSTTSTTWTFRNLSPGEHQVRVDLATANGRKIGQGTTLKLKVP